VLSAALVAAALVGVAPAPAGAEHQVYYRYVVLGYVRDARGIPVSHAQVELIRDKTGLSYLGTTDATGLYVIIARLGDESAGEPLTVRVGRAATRVTARFDPANHTEPRGTRLDLQGDLFQERAAAFAPTLARFLATETR
jgi:hypothetical protein